ncbi:MAG: hypothetical protein WCE62_08115, partial [Polyangiales bacterium]
MSVSRKFSWIACSALLALTVAGCSSDDASSGDTTGSLNLNLELASGAVINEVDYLISGNDITPIGGTIDTSAPGATASVEVFGLPPGTGYLVELSATTEDGTMTCQGSAPFDVSVGVATDVMVMLNCKRPPRYGAVRVNGKFNICADLIQAVASPLQTSVGNDIDLSAIGSDDEGDAIKYIWSATGGSIADSSAASTTYTCGEVGDQTITIVVSDDDFVYCMDQWTFPVTCVQGEGDLCEDVTCDDTGNDCTEAACNPSNGACEVSNVEDGTECDGGEGTCSGGECVAGNPCEGVTCDDTGNECTSAACNPASGQCETSNVADGTACDGGAGMCVAGSCMATDLCEGVTCDDTGNECTVAACNNQTGNCDVMNAPEGTSCGDGGMCVAGVCQIPSEPIIAAGDGSTTWTANTTPSGSNGGVTASGGGCAVFVTALNTTIYLQVGITLAVTSDGANNIGTGWTIQATHFLLPTLQNAAELGGLSINAVLTNASGGPIPSGLTAAAQGQLIGAFVTGTTLTIAT